MRRAALVVLCTALFLGASAAPAHAWWWWADDYSGPGPFTGPVFQWRLLCFNDPLPVQRLFDVQTKVKDVTLLRARNLLTSLVALAAADEAERKGQPLGLQESRVALRGKFAETDVAFSVLDRFETLKPETLLQKSMRVQAIVERGLEMRASVVRASPNPGSDVLRSFNSLKKRGSERSYDDIDPLVEIKYYDYGDTKTSNAMMVAGALGVAPFGCQLQPSKNPVASVYVRLGVLWSKDNHLWDDGGHRVWLLQPEVGFASFISQNKALEISTAVGLSRASDHFPNFFSSKDKTDFDAFWRFYWKPIVVSYAPIPLVRTKTGFWPGLGRSFTINGQITYVPRGFDAADFGATGDFKVDREILAGVGIVFDFSRF